MFSMKKEKYFRRSPGKNIAFYISLALCISAVAGAAWTTYGSVNEYDDPAPIVEKQEKSALDAANEMSGQKYESSVQDESKSDAQSSVPAQTASKAEESNAGNSKISKPIAKGEILKPYSPKDPIHSETMNDWRTHPAVDITAKDGEPVHSVLSGRVSRIYTDPLLGNCITIESSGGYELLYSGVTNISLAREGSQVTAGETIGYIGQIPSESKDPTHLHLEAKLNSNPIDPTILF